MIRLFSISILGLIFLFKTLLLRVIEEVSGG